MTAWEHHQVLVSHQVTGKGRFDPAGWETRSDGATYRWGDYLAQMGAEGWELAGIAAQTPISTANFLAIFKRPAR